MSTESDTSSTPTTPTTPTTPSTPSTPTITTATTLAPTEASLMKENSEFRDRIRTLEREKDDLTHAIIEKDKLLSDLAEKIPESGDGGFKYSALIKSQRNRILELEKVNAENLRKGARRSSVSDDEQKALKTKIFVLETENGKLKETVASLSAAVSSSSVSSSSASSSSSSLSLPTSNVLAKSSLFGPTVYRRGSVGAEQKDPEVTKLKDEVTTLKRVLTTLVMERDNARRELESLKKTSSTLTPSQ